MNTIPKSFWSSIWVCLSFAILALGTLNLFDFMSGDQHAIISGFLLLVGLFFAVRGIIQGLREFKLGVNAFSLFAAIINFGVVIIFVTTVILNLMDIRQAIN